MKINVQVSISRNSKDEISLTFVDSESHTRFLDVRMTPENFAMAVTGFGFVASPAEVLSLDSVGKRKVSEKRSLECPLTSYTEREKLVKWLKENGQEEGWEVDSYLGSKSSISNHDGKTILHYRVFKFVEARDA